MAITSSSLGIAEESTKGSAMHAVISLSGFGEYKTYEALYNAQSAWTLIHGSEAPSPISLAAFDKIQASIHSFNGATTQAPPLSAVTASSASAFSPGPFADAKSNPPSPTKSGTSPAKTRPATTSVSPTKAASPTKASTSPTKATPIFKPARIPPHKYTSMLQASTCGEEFIKFIESNSSIPSKEQAMAGAGAGLSAEDEQDGATVFWAVLRGKRPGVYRGWMQASEASLKRGGLLPLLTEIEADRLFVTSYMKGNVYIVED
ncbi:hypothetical protein EV421DRAFT_1900614 [Armillaria borealis]|uniref:Uncharacterized protein n=1 Tax=Armillaria borealis TaxID=47425 RepID=A0AA39JWM5_9AGAR|nr:hypothetical protein EV421DRAFT_1900614 [Armillaria borealis]